MAILNIILKTVKPDERIYIPIYRNLNFLFFETADRFPSQHSSFQTSAMWGFPFTKVIEFLKVR